MKNKINFFSIFRIEKRNLYRFSDFSEKSINENIDILKNFTKINSGIERWKLIFFNAINALKDPENGTYLSHLGDLTSYSALIEIKEKMISDETGREILKNKPRLRENINLETLLKLDQNTFGFQYANWMKNHEFHPKERPIVKYIPDFELAYIYQRYKEIHDFLHILLYYDISIHNELAIKWFEMVQLGIPSAAISAFFGQILLSKKEITDLYCNQMKKIILNANNCKFIMNIYFEKEFETNLEDLRKKLNLIVLD